jgi:hypothetical protein
VFSVGLVGRMYLHDLLRMPTLRMDDLPLPTHINFHKLLRSQGIAKQLRNLLQALPPRLGQKEEVHKRRRKISRNEQCIIPPPNILQRDGRDLREDVWL